MPLPFQQAREIEQAVLGYLRATFAFQDQEVKAAFDRFLGGVGAGEGIFKGPYLSLKLPFEQSSPGDIPLTIKPEGFSPFAHQMQAFDRLTTQNGHTPLPTILTTGTGSGKTESFLYPLLDYCYQQRHLPGIKAIILYPMNALATDQAGRLARTIWEHPLLHPQNREPDVKAGLFIGEGKKKPNGPDLPTVMGPGHLIEDRHTIVEVVPDILLTNFKMLDFALLRSKYHGLWKHNLKSPGLLKFLVLDELHTYDGAQGTDVANLIRRLKLKLSIEPGQLCPVGTSATLGTGAESRAGLAAYAQKVFGEQIEPDALIEERRRDVDEYFPTDSQRDVFPSKAELRASLGLLQKDPAAYVAAQPEVWSLRGKAGVELGRDLQCLRIVRELARICSSAPVSLEVVRKSLAAVIPAFRDLESDELKDAAIASLLTLLAQAQADGFAVPFPFMFVQIQSWLRAPGRIQRLMQPVPAFAWEEDVEQSGTSSLPPWHCRECGASGWVALKAETLDRFNPDLDSVYRASMERDKNLWYVDTWHPDHRHSGDYEPTDFAEWWVDERTQQVYDREQPGAFRVMAYRKYEGSKSQAVCPRCNSRHSLAFIGAGAASLTSVAISQLLSSDTDQTPLRNRKVLSFTNSVQDAAHRAGFFQARNYRFLFRTALQQVVHQNGEGSMSLPEVYEAFNAYWLTKTGGEPAYIYQFFPADQYGRVDPRDHQVNGQVFDAGFLDEFNRRMSWEIWSQYTFNALIGRTLERAGASGAYFEPDVLQKAYTVFAPWLQTNSLEEVDEASFLRFLSGFLHRLRVRGGVDHPYLRVFRTDYPSYFSITQGRNKPFFLMRNFGKRSRLPGFLSLDRTKGNLDLVTIGQASNRNWFHSFFARSFLMGRSDHMLVNDFYRELLQVLSADEIGILDRKEANGHPNFGLRPEVIRISASVRRYVCPKCNGEIHSTALDGLLLKGSACLRFHCEGKYELAELFADDTARFYKQVYERGNVVRVFAKEHTGLLDRLKREEIETSFKGKEDPQGLNVLVATSTLEMGIDIGDLNQAVNIGIPPTTANFLQRIGRAGRKAGQALLLNLASRGKHDLYFFTAPEEMMAGSVATPGCFLEAREILRRHLLAFFVDSWTLANPDKHTIPAILQPLLIRSGQSSSFIDKLRDFIKIGGEPLFDRFRKAYMASSPGNTRLAAELEELAKELRAGDFDNRLQRFLPSLANEYQYLNDQLVQLTRRLEVMAQSDPERVQLERDRQNIRQAVRSFRKRQTLEQLTNLGYLPNYGFPETGVELEARLRRANALDERSRPLYLEFNPIVRPASQAIRELAPGNRFYGQGYHFPIKGVRVLNWQEEVQRFRFCSRCDHLALDKGTPKQGCPKCGDTSWFNQANTHDMLDFKKAIAYEDAEKAGLDDSSDERDEGYYVMSRHFELPAHGGQGAHVLGRIPFGIELIQQVTFTEINTGDQNALTYTPNKVKIQDEEVSGRGFIVCKVCGMAHVHTRTLENKELSGRDYHFPYCKFRERSYLEVPDEVFGEVYLKRQITTEVLRLLLPVQEINSSLRLALFKAGISLGLKHYFGGNPQHIMMREYREINIQTGLAQHYLMLVDTIPGGTGYLGQIADTGNFTRVLRHAYEAISTCTCGPKDGCYHCVYSYANQFERKMISRREAEVLFRQIIDQCDEWIYRPEGFAGVESGQIEESELERLFVQLLEQFFQAEPQAKQGWHIRREKKSGSVRYRLTVPHSPGKTWEYVLTPQVELSHGLTRADFLLEVSQAPKELNDVQVPKVAIYLDGYAFHASRNHFRFLSDIQKRWELRTKGEYTWTMTWEDMQRFIRQLAKQADTGDEAAQWFDMGTWNNFRNKHPLVPLESPIPWAGENQFGRFLHWLKNPVETSQQTLRWLLGCHKGASAGFLNTEQLSAAWKKPGEPPECMAKPEGRHSFLPLNRLPGTSDLPLSAFIRVDGEEARISLSVPDFSQNGSEFPNDTWNRFWQLFNLVQWINGLRIALPNRTVLEDNVGFNAQDDDEWEGIRSGFEEKYHNLVRMLFDRQADFYPEQGYELFNDLDEVIAEAAIGSESLKWVVDAKDQRSAGIFENQGYRVISLDEVSDDLI